MLDVGAGPYGLACVRPEQRFVGVDIDYPSEPVATMVALQTMLVLGDLMDELVGSSQRAVRDNAAAWTELLAGASFGPSLRAGWVLERRTPRVALVTEADLEGSALAAVRAPGAILRSGPHAGAEVGRGAADRARRLR